MGRTVLGAEQEALQVARLWDPAVSLVTNVRSGENSTWAADLHGVSSIMRVTSERHRTRDQIEAELDFVEYLAARGLMVARPLVNQEGHRVAELSVLERPERRGWAVVFERLRGRHYEYYSADVGRLLFRLWGETMGRLHDLSSRFEPPRGRRRPHWYDDAVAGCATNGVPVIEESLGFREELIGWLRRFQPDPGHYGLVHGDFERTNFLLLDGAIGFFDFDDSCYHWFAWDIACALWVFRNATPSERSHFLGWFLEGYSAVRAPDAERLAGFTELVRLRTVALLLHRLRNPERFASETEREWVGRTRAWLNSSWSW